MSIAPISTKSPAALDSVDALRGFAILLVLFVHVQAWAAPGGGLLARAAAEGARGVQLFYIVSAFTLTRSLLYRKEQGAARIYSAFAIRRFFRIAPLFYTVALINLIDLGLSARHWAPEGLTGWHIASAFVFLNAWVPHAITSVVDGGWSIAIEANFYLLLPFVLLLVTDLRKAMLIGVLGGLLGYACSEAILAIFVPEPKADYVLAAFFKFWLPYQLPAFGAGIALYFLPRASWLDRPMIAPLILMVSVLAFLLLGKFFPMKVFFLAVFAYVLIHKPVGLLCCAPIRFIGKISYSLYFLHFLVLRYGSAPARDFLASIPDQTLRFWVAYGLLVVIAGFFATLTWLLIEKPFIRWGGILARRVEQRPA